MTAKHLLDELETLPSHARIRRMLELGRSAAHDPDVAVTLTALEQGDFYERFLALHACFGSYDGAHVLRALTDSSRIIRGVAIHLSVLACNEEQLRQALTLVPRDGRLPLLWKLYHHGYETLIDAFLEQLAENHDLQLRQLLPCGSPPLVRRFLERFQHCMELVDWRRLARRHPLLACELLQARAAATPSLDVQLVAFVNGVLPVLATKQPDQALLLVKTLAQTVPLSHLDLDALLLQRPAEVVGLALQGEDLGELAFYRVAHKLDKERLLALIETHVTVWECYHLWLPALKSEARLALYASFASSWRDQRGCLTPDLIALLPQDQREQEGRRHLALDALATRPEERLRYAAFLPWDEALYLLDPFLHDPSEKVRSLALQALMRAVCYQRSHLSDVLALICEHLNEPDPVRGHMINQLAELPRGIWTSEHLEGLEQIIQGVINAFDTSSFTLGALSLLITRLLTCAPEWSATQLALVVQKHGLTFNYGCMENRLSEAEVRQIGPTLRPVLLSWTEREDKGNLAEAIRLFGRQVRAFDALLDALELALSHKPDFSLGNEILLTIIKYRSERAAQLIPELLQGHRDWITYPVVSHYLHHHRQDLLTPLLKYRKYSDVFRDTQNRTFTYRRRVRPLKPLTRGFARWTSRQQAMFARTLLRVINDEASDQPTIIRAITQLAALPALPAKHLIALANDQRPVVRDTALLHLSRLDNGEGMPVLQEALHDQRAVRALYALRPWFLTAPTQQALALLRTVPLTKVTIAKEVVRLCGEMPGEEAYQELLALEKQELHPNVRIALLRALWSHLERDETWQILEREAQSADMTLALSAAHLNMRRELAKAHRIRDRFRRKAQQPATLHHVFRFAEWNIITLTHLSGEHLLLQAQQRLMHLYALLLQRPEIEVRAAVLRGCIRLAAADRGQELLSQLLTVMDSDNEDICAAAASAIFGTCLAEDAPLIGQAMLQLLPNRTALQRALHAIQPHLLLKSSQLLLVVRAVLEALASDPLTIGHRVDLAISFLPWEEVASVLIEAATTGILHADALERACHKLSYVLGRYGHPGRPDSKEMFRLEEMLAAHPDEGLRRIALAALITQGELPPGWDEKRRARLQVYRADPSPLVAAAAQFTILPPAEG